MLAGLNLLLLIPSPSKLIAGAREQSFRRFLGLADPRSNRLKGKFVPVSPDENNSIFFGQLFQHAPDFYSRAFHVQVVVDLPGRGFCQGIFFGAFQRIGFAQVGSIIISDLVARDAHQPGLQR